MSVEPSILVERDWRPERPMLTDKLGNVARGRRRPPRGPVTTHDDVGRHTEASDWYNTAACN